MRTFLLLLFASFFAATAFAEGDGTDSNKQAAASLLNEGNELFEQGLYEPALARYKAAYELYPSPKLFFSMAEAHRELAHSPTSAELYERFLNESGVGEKSPLHDQARKRLAELDGLLGRIAVECDVPGTEVFVDGRAVGKTPLSGVRVLPGKHEVALRTVGFEPHRTTTEVVGGDTAVVNVALRPVVAAPTPVPGPRVELEAPREDGSVTGSWWFWALIGTAAVVGGAVIVVAATSGGSFERTGELGVTSTSDWTPLQ